MVECRISWSKFIASLYTTNKHAEKNTMNTYPFTITSNYLKINPNKGVKDIYNEERDKRKTLKNGKTWIGGINILKMIFYKKLFIDPIYSQSRSMSYSSPK